MREMQGEPAVQPHALFVRGNRSFLYCAHAPVPLVIRSPT
ncbi:hypothetical protein [Devosia sp. DBB001]|nr:hypothetical protein [Devosia sp. DBB001]